MTDAAVTQTAPPRRPRTGARAALGPAFAARLKDPRLGQICAQALLIGFGLTALGFQLSVGATLAAAAGALGAEWLGRRATGRPFDPLSPLITAGSLTLLLRASDIWIFLLAGALAIGSKFLFRMGGRHIFNPAALALFLLPLAAQGAWVSPGQWGALGLWAAGLAGLGAAVAGRAARLDTSLAFLAVWAALAFARAAWFGDPVAIPLHQLQSGALIVFAFFMISDPATTPDARAVRLLHGAAVAALGFWLQTAWITDTGPIWALVFLAPFVGAARLLRRRVRDGG